jgi:adenylosuccinate synthase
VVVRNAARLNSLTGIAITKLDVLSGLKTLKICTAYEYKGDRLPEFPSGSGVLEACQPIYEELPGWREDITAVKDDGGLPANARAYLRRLEELVETPIHIISVGPGRDETIMLKDPFDTP